MFKKILLMFILVMSVVGCELFDAKRWDRINREDAERGVKCYYKRANGDYYCKDRYGNITY